MRPFVGVLAFLLAIPALAAVTSVQTSGTMVECSSTIQCYTPAQEADLLGLADRVTSLEARAPVPGPAGAVGATGPTGPAGTNANLVAATLTSLGSIKANITQIARTTTPISVSLSGISVLGLTALVTTATVTVTGVQLGDFVQASFAGTPPTGLIPTAAQVTAANTVVVTFAATQALTLAAGTQSLNFVWTR